MRLVVGLVGHRGLLFMGDSALDCEGLIGGIGPDQTHNVGEARWTRTTYLRGSRPKRCSRSSGFRQKVGCYQLWPIEPIRLRLRRTGLVAPCGTPCYQRVR